MIALPDKNYLSPQDFLAWEVTQPDRYEYIDGHAYAMAGGTLPHNIITGNLFVALRRFLRGTSCRVFMADVRVYVAEQGPYFYPDLVVSCDPRDLNATQALRHPCLIIEVLSPGTQSFDKNEKFRHYRRLASLKEYVLIHSDRPALDHYYRRQRNLWEFTSHSPEESDLDGSDLAMPRLASGKLTPPLDTLSFELQSLQFSDTLAMIYEDITFSEIPSGEGKN